MSGETERWEERAVGEGYCAGFEERKINQFNLGEFQRK